MTPVLAAPPVGPDWPMFGQNIGNTATSTSVIGTGNVANLTPNWSFATHGPVSARAAVVDGVAYFPDWAGYVYAVNASTGVLIWQKNILSDYFGGVAPDGSSATSVVSRTSPDVDATTGTLYLGTQLGAYMLGINTSNGSLKWMAQLDSNPEAVDTGSPIAYNGVLYVGVASLEEGAAINPTYACCSFRGSVVALNATTGSTLWKDYVTPPGYSGNAVWGSTLVPDPQAHLLFATTGNNYTTPIDPTYQSCLNQSGKTGTSCINAYNTAHGTSYTTTSPPPDPTYAACISAGGTATSCNSPDDHYDSVMAFSMGNPNVADGTLVWSQRLGDADDWNVACFFSGDPNCPTGAGPDYDFGSGANLITYQGANGPVTILGAGQKSGIYSAFDPATGKLLWATQVGPGSALGGMEWGSATDGQRIYVQIGDDYGEPYTLQPSGKTDNAGSWSALDPATGKILWQTADPNGAIDIGPMTVANGVVYAPSMGINLKTGSFSASNTPTMFALDAATGNVLWNYASGGSVIAGAVVTKHAIFWGSGYSNLAPFVGNDEFYSFTIGH